MNEREQIEQAIKLIEEQRPTLGDAAVEAALVGLRQKLAAVTSPAPVIIGPPQGLDHSDERKIVTILFADLSGFTALAERMDPEAVRDLMNNCFSHLVPCITRYEGVIDKFVGDQIMGLFGAPLAHENDAERAVRAALDIQTALNEFNHIRQVDLGVHLGLNTGLVLAGEIGAGERQGYSVIGDAVNLASRLEEVSERGQILVGPDTYRLTAPLFNYQALTPVKVKGKAESVQVYQVMGIKAQPERIRGLDAKGIHSRFVGRKQELTEFLSRVNNLATGQGGVVFIIGDAGLGKSRLLAEVQASTQGMQPSPLWLEGHALSFTQAISYWPFQVILRNWAGISEDDAEPSAWYKLKTKVELFFGSTGCYLAQKGASA